jgi:hypothetical protein
VIALLAALSLAASTHECAGLQQCVPIKGPWVVASRTPSQFELTCPKGYLVGGTDAELTSRAIDLSFLATSGSPVSPGRSTSRTIVFVAQYVGTGRAAVTYRPHAGCVPSSGGGRRTPTMVHALVPPGKPTTRHTRTVHVSTSRQIAVACGLGERLVGTNVARAIATATPPSSAVAAKVRTTSKVGDNRIVVSAQGTAHAVVQVTAICAGGR